MVLLPMYRYNVAIAQGYVDIKAKLSFPNSPKFNAKIINLYGNIVVNPRRMRRRVMVVVLCVCLSVCLSVNSVTATYFVCESQAWCYMIPYGVSKPCIVWISLKTLCFPVLAIFTQDCYLPP